MIVFGVPYACLVTANFQLDKKSKNVLGVFAHLQKIVCSYAEISVASLRLTRASVAVRSIDHRSIASLQSKLKCTPTVTSQTALRSNGMRFLPV